MLCEVVRNVSSNIVIYVYQYMQRRCWKKMLFLKGLSEIFFDMQYEDCYIYIYVSNIIVLVTVVV